jgi:hypothetical protein
MSTTPPNKVYRYRRIDARTIDLLCYDQLYFADPTQFNDPFDCDPKIVSDSGSDALRAILAKLIERRIAAETLASLRNARVLGRKAEAYSNRSGKQGARQELKTISYNSTNPDYDCSEEDAERSLLVSGIEREILKQYNRGVCCFSAVVNNILLWSHYADEHKGFCIGYSLARIPEPKLHKVVYGGSRSVKTSLIARALLENDDEAQHLLDRDVLLRKAPSWRYECEWRLLSDRGVHDSPLKLKDVTFGLRCPDALKYAVINVLNRRTIKFFEMYELSATFTLKRRAVDIDELRAYFPKIARSGEEAFGSVIK